MSDAAEKAIYGSDLLGGPNVIGRKGPLSKKFVLPPFTVMNAAEGWWQNRKQDWRLLGIKSELGRGANVLGHPETTGNMDFYAQKRKLEEELGRQLETAEAVGILAERGLIGMMESGKGRDENLMGFSGSTEDYRNGTGKYARGDAKTFGSGSPGDLSKGYKGKSGAPTEGGTNKIAPGGTGKNTAWRHYEGTGQRESASLEEGLTFGMSVGPYDGRQDKRDEREKKKVETASLTTGLVYGMTNDPYRKPGEEAPSAAGQGTSIFDPVLCELAYRWFCPIGGQVVDPFAGGSVRGIVAATLGRKYWGNDLSVEQILANEQQARDLVYGNVPQVEDVYPRDDNAARFRVVRDDNVPGGTKERAVRKYLADYPEETFVYASPAEGYAQVALARVCREQGKRCVIFTADRKEEHPRTTLARSYGAEIEKVKPGYLTVVEARAREYVQLHKEARLLPFGLHSKRFIRYLSEIALSTGESPKEVWCAAGSGTLATALKLAWPDAHIHAVQVGREVPQELKDAEGVTVHVYDGDFSEPAKVLPPFPSVPEYDAKAWEVMLEKGSDGALFWNVAADAAPLRWTTGDSREMLQYAPEADFIFSCPPYADLEQYSEHPADLSNMEYPEFREAYAEIILKACEKLKNDRFACVVVGDVRDKDGLYYNFPGDTIKAFKKAGLSLYNEAILVTAVGSLSVRCERQFFMTRKFGKTHQNVLVFVKGDPRRATDAATGMTEKERQDFLKAQAEARKKATDPQWGEDPKDPPRKPKKETAK